MRFSQIVVFSSLLLCAGGCGYQWRSDFPQGSRPVIAVPFIHDDEDGSLTEEVVLRLQSSGLAKVSATKGDFRLIVTIDKNFNQQIGYRRDPQKIKNEIQKNLISAEQRRTIDVQVTLFHSDTEKIAFGPYKLSVWADYDYVDGDSYKDLTFPGPFGAPIIVLPFSLGQLEEIESAKLAATKPLYRKLAQKIVDVISAEW
jgi:hypothetical protein